MSTEDLQTEEPVEEGSESSVITIDHAARSDIGMRREENQDSFGIIEGEGFRLFIVADGMGGVQGGALASSIAVETLKEEISADAVPSSDDMVTAIKNANTRIFDRGNSEPSLTGMGTTLVALLFHGTQLSVFNVGDSRAYRFRHQQVDQLTEDHTLVMELVRSGSIDEEQAKNHPVSHMLTRSLGPAEEVEVDVFEIDQGPFQSEMFLICSDGLYNLVKDGEMLALMLENRLDTAVDKLIELANKRGGSDNITIIAAETAEGFPLLPENLLQAALGESDEQGIDETQEIEPEQGEQGAETSGQNAASSGHASKDPKQGESSSDGAIDKDSSKEAGSHFGAHANGSSDAAGAKTVGSRLSMEQLRSAYGNPGATGSPEGARTVHEPKARMERSPEARKERTSRPSVLPKNEPKTIFGSYGSAVVSLLGAAICGYMVSVLFRSPEPFPGEGLLSSASSRSSGHAEPAGRRDSGSGRGSDSTRMNAPPFEAGGTGAEMFGGGSLEAGLSTIERRQKTLSSKLRRVEEKIVALDAPLSGQVGQLLIEATRQLESLDQKLSETKADVDAFARRLAVWNGRRTRLESSEPITMVSEIAVSSEEVRRKKEEFEAATWKYLKEAERLEYSPNDAELAKRVTSLVRARNDRMDELFGSLRAAVNDGILDSQQRISDLTVEADRIETEIRGLQDTITFSKVLSSGDSSIRTSKRNELAKEREMILSELNELNRLAETLPALRFGGR